MQPNRPSWAISLETGVVNVRGKEGERVAERSGPQITGDGQFIIKGDRRLRITQKKTPQESEVGEEEGGMDTLLRSWRMKSLLNNTAQRQQHHRHRTRGTGGGGKNFYKQTGQRGRKTGGVSVCDQKLHEATEREAKDTFNMSQRQKCERDIVKEKTISKHLKMGIKKKPKRNAPQLVLLERPWYSDATMDIETDKTLWGGKKAIPYY